jgi:ribokinase
VILIFGSLNIDLVARVLSSRAPPSRPFPEHQTVDTTGAGDTFVGAFACALDEKAPLQKTLEVACEAAALKCLKAGAQNGMSMRGAIKSIA